MIEIVPATKELAEAYYRTIPSTFRGYCAVEDGKPLGFAGIHRDGAHLVAFLDAGPELRAHKRTMVEGRRLIRKMLDDARRPVFATMDEQEPGAPKLLKRMGFMPVHDNVVVRMPS